MSDPTTTPVDRSAEAPIRDEIQPYTQGTEQERQALQERNLTNVR